MLACIYLIFHDVFYLLYQNLTLSSFNLCGEYLIRISTIQNLIENNGKLIGNVTKFRTAQYALLVFTSLQFRSNFRSKRLLI